MSDPIEQMNRTMLRVTCIVTAGVVLVVALIVAGVVTHDVLSYRAARVLADEGRCPHRWRMVDSHLKACDVCGETLRWSSRNGTSSLLGEWERVELRTPEAPK